jgi:hypothetical protein
MPRNSCVKIPKYIPISNDAGIDNITAIYEATGLMN